MNEEIFNKLIKKSLELFEINQSDKKHFSFLLDGRKIVSVGWNFQNKTHPLAERFKYKYARIHSELHCIKNFPFAVNELRFYKMVNIRLGIKKDIRISKPCKCCQMLLSFFDIGEVWYSNRFCKFERL